MSYLSIFSDVFSVVHTGHNQFSPVEPLSPSIGAHFLWSTRTQFEHFNVVFLLQHLQQYMSCLTYNWNE